MDMLSPLRNKVLRFPRNFQQFTRPRKYLSSDEKRNELLALNDELDRLEKQKMNNAVRTRMAAIEKRIFDLQKAVDSITALRLIPGPQANLGVTNQPARFPLTLEVDQNRSNARTPRKVELKN